MSAMRGLHLEVVIGATVLAVAYVAAWRASGERVSPARAAAFGAALAGLVGALNGPLHDLADDAIFSAHMVQHLILTLVVAPLLLAGTPSFMADALLDPLLARTATRGLLRVLTRPLAALAAWSLALVVWHLPGPYAAALDSHALHFVQHATLMGAAVLAWWPIVSPSRRLPSLPYAARLLYVFAFGIPMTIVAAMITGAEQVIYPFPASGAGVRVLAPLEDQRLGGILMWVPAAIVPLTAFTAVFFRWAAAESEDRAEANAFPE
ncbi:MAG TPA: cytochrome c oxidase assembly protein [Candidatus Acidoferrum sp.]|nr:cytochrome c oxidase assembly protein [Candidatus Acidoferrum sp.]